jgi:hypothetical protein
VESEHESFCPIRNFTFLYVKPRTIVPVRGYTSRYLWTSAGSHASATDPDDFYWGCKSPVDPCLGNCMDVWKIYKHAKNYGHHWVRIQGLAVNLYVGLACFGLPRNNGDVRPECIQPTDPALGMCDPAPGTIRY